MMKSARESWRSVTLGIAVAAGAAMLGLTLAPPPAAAAINEGYRCGGVDWCTSGDRTCCEEGDHKEKVCSTYCPIIIEGDSPGIPIK